MAMTTNYIDGGLYMAGDGITNCAAGFLAACSASKQTDLPLFCPPGVYLFGKSTGSFFSADLPFDGLTIYGVPGKTTFKHPIGLPNSSTTLLRLNKRSNVTIRGIDFDGSWGAVIGVTDALRVWQSGTLYNTGKRIWNGSAVHAYECITSGTSAATGSGPTGTAASTIDNGVEWKYIGDGKGDPCNQTGQIDPKNYLLMIRGCNNIKIEDCNFRQCYGDGVWIGHAADPDAGTASFDITLSRVNVDISARNGFTLGGPSSRIRMRDCHLTNIWSQALDSEPVTTGTRDWQFTGGTLGTWWQREGHECTPLSIVGGGGGTPTANTQCSNIRVSDTLIEGTTFIERANNVVLSGITCIMDFAVGSPAAVLIEFACDGILIEDCDFYSRTSTGGSDGSSDSGVILIYNYASGAKHHTPTGITIAHNRLRVKNGRNGITIAAAGGDIQGETGTITALSGALVTDSTKTWPTNQFTGCNIRIGSAHAAIIANDATTLTLQNANPFLPIWVTPTGMAVVPPASGSSYMIWRNTGIINICDNDIDLGDDGYGNGKYGIYTQFTPNNIGGIRTNITKNRIKNAAVDAIRVKFNSIGSYHLLAIEDNIAWNDIPSAPCQTVIGFQGTPHCDKMIMRGNRQGEGVTNAYTGLSVGVWLVNDGDPSEWAGFGTPEGVVVAKRGSQFSRRDGSAGTCHYIKESDTGNTGWVAK